MGRPIASNKIHAHRYAEKLRHIDDHSFNVNNSLNHSSGFYTNVDFARASNAARKAFSDISTLLQSDGKVIETIASCLDKKDEARAMRILRKGY